MIEQIINLSLMLVIEEVDTILRNFQEYDYKVAFSNQKLRHQLIIHILDQIPNYYTIIEEEQPIPKDPRILYASYEERQDMENLIHQSIVEIFREYADSIR